MERKNYPRYRKYQHIQLKTLLNILKNNIENSKNKNTSLEILEEILLRLD